MPELRILTLNFFLRPPGIYEPGSKGDWKVERLRLFAETQFANYDIIALQETFSSLSQRKAELVNLAKKHGLVHSAIGKPQRIWKLRVDAGLLILSRYPVVNVDEWTFQRGTELGDWLAAKGVLYARIQLPSNGTDTAEKVSYLHMFTTHYQSTDSKRAIELRHRQFVESKEFIDAMLTRHGRQPHEPVLLVGDLNVDARANGEDGVNHGWEYTVMTDILSGGAAAKTGDTSVRYDLHDICYDALKEHPITTSRLRVGEGRPLPDRKCIDFILSFDAPAQERLPGRESRHQWANVRVETFEVEDQPFSFLSDHFGVAAHLQLS
ncbi:hypothetical protein HDU85_001462 [Gaertneriomyces sp. JEL0708]|nr:hypothetical protein HDU85_001462 [Gaertneriomyces sp. JEL0708]